MLRSRSFGWAVFARHVGKQLCENKPNTVCTRWQHTASRIKMKGNRDRGYFLLIIPVAAFGLGTWQVQRRKWKLGLMESLEQKTRAPPIPFPENLDDLQDLEYRKVTLSGTFDHSKELYISPRSPVADDDQPSRFMTGGMGGRQTIGAYVITPFKLADRDLTILVNRGFVPRSHINPERRAAGQVQGEVPLTGVVRLTEKRQAFGGKNEPSHNRWHHRDHEAMAEVTGASPICVDATADCTIPGGPVGGQTRVSLRNEHMSYLLTWYSLSAITGFMYYLKYWR